MEFWILLIASIVNFGLALVIFSRAAKVTSAAYFGMSALFVGLWAIGTIFMTYSETQAFAYFGLFLFLIAPMFTTLYMVLFSKHFSGVDFPSGSLAPLLFSSLTVLGVVVTVSQLKYDDILTVVPGGENIINFATPGYMLYGSFFSIMFAIAYTYLLVGLIRSHGKARLQLRLVLSGILLASFPAIITNILLPYYGNSNLLWLGPTLTIFYIVTTCYAMVRHGLFDLRSALVLTFTYVLSLAALAALYYFIGLAITLIFSQGSLSIGFSGLDVAIALLLAFLFQPIRRFFDKFTNSIFYQDNYSVDDFFAQLSKALTSTNDLHGLLKKASEKISYTMKAADTSFVVYTGADRSDQVGVGRYSHISYKDVRWLDDFIGISSAEPKVLSLLDEEDELLRRMMVSHRIAIILPLVRQGVQMGYLFLGEHKRSNYSARDIRVVRSLADELVIAIQNALSVEQIKELNAHLEQRVDAATRELRRSNAQLQRLDESKDEFISMASHQLRTPLTSIKGYISMLMEGDIGKVTTEQKHVLNEAFISSERVVRLISDFLNVSRLQTGKFVIDKHPIDLALLVQREIDGLKPNAQARNMKFVYKAPKNIPVIELDENKIQQVVMNFSDNALYYSKEKGTINVTLKKVPGWVEFLVKDDGIGVPKEEQAHLFNKFFRATNARRARPDGTGVGLFLAKKVIDDHDGEIIFTSKEGKGSTFGFRLPLSKK
ncbi:MAG: ATP-binding protein [Candidatus Microsaccharimonas sp.]